MKSEVSIRHLAWDNQWSLGVAMGRGGVGDPLCLWNSLILGGVKNGQKYLGTVIPKLHT